MIANSKKKQKTGGSDNFFASPFIKIFLVIIVIFLVFADISVYRTRKKLNTQIDSLKEKIAEIEEKNNKLKEGITRADDKDYIEKIAREELDLQIQDEKVVSFIMPETKQTEETNVSINYWNPRNWLGWLNNIVAGMVQW